MNTQKYTENRKENSLQCNKSNSDDALKMMKIQEIRYSWIQILKLIIELLNVDCHIPLKEQRKKRKLNYRKNNCIWYKFKLILV